MFVSLHHYEITDFLHELHISEVMTKTDQKQLAWQTRIRFSFWMWFKILCVCVCVCMCVCVGGEEGVLV